MQVTMQRGILIVPACTSIAVDFESAEVRHELHQVLRALAFDLALRSRQVRKLLRGEAPGRDNP